WQTYRDQKRHLSGSKLRKWCKDNFLSFVRLREWEDIHNQLSELVEGMALPSPPRGEGRGGVGATRRDGESERAHSGRPTNSARPRERRLGSPTPQRPVPSQPKPPADQGLQELHNHIHRALLTGLLGNIGVKTETGEYAAGRNVKFNI